MWSHSTADYINVTAGAGSYSANPFFVSGTNFHITEYSPTRLMASDGTTFIATARAASTNENSPICARLAETVRALSSGWRKAATMRSWSLVRMIQVEARLYKMQRGEPLTVKGITSLLSNVSASRRYFPFLVQLILGGVDRYGPKLYSLDALGGQIEEQKIVSTGSGSPIAYGVLEAMYKPNLSVQEGTILAQGLFITP